MAAEQEHGSSNHPMMVGEAFVHQYYQILLHSPELVHRFYQDCSKLGRPNGSGSMDTISTLKAINEKILASDTSKFKSEVDKIDAQDSYKGGVLILVTGHLVAHEIKRNFVQTFFLAPQEKGYFVLNDIFRYTETSDYQQQKLNHESKAVPALSPTVDTQESYNGGVLMLMSGKLSGKDSTVRIFSQAFFLAPKEKGYFVLNDIYTGTDATDLEQHVKHDSEAVPLSHELVLEKPEEKPSFDVVEDEKKGKPLPTVEKTLNVVYESPEVKTVEKSLDGSVTITDSKPAAVPGDAPKKSYASIVRVLKDNAVPSSAFVASPIKLAISAPESQPSAPPAGTSAAPPPEIMDAQESEVFNDASMIYIRNLPMNATPAQLEEEFKRFGAIKKGGIQVRSNKLQGFCFGFVEFELASAVQQAIEASPVLVGGRPAYIEEKRPSGSRINGPRRYVAGKGNFRSDGARGRGGYYGNGRGFGRGDFANGNGSNGSRGGGYHHQRMVNSRAVPANGLPGNSPLINDVASGVPASA